jgi:hypothetical protein
MSELCISASGPEEVDVLGDNNNGFELRLQVTKKYDENSF